MFSRSSSEEWRALPIYEAPILVVEDNEVSRLMLHRVLRARGFSKILLAESAEDAMEKIADFKPDLLILDILMPGMDGFECCRAVRQMPAFRDLPILIQTVISEPELRLKAFEMGASDFVSKPIYPDELCARVMVHLERRLSLKSLQVYKSRIETELDSARGLQASILPLETDIADVKQRCQLDIASHFCPSSEIGGDFWGIKRVFQHQTALWMVDFSGHGVASALNAFRLQAYLMEQSHLAARPGEYLSHLNDKLLQLLLRGQFATMFYGIIDTQGSRLFYAAACNPHPIVLRSSGKVEMIDGSGSPLGIGMQLYATKDIEFLLGDTLVLYSDALTETPNQEGGYITEEQLMRLLEASSGLSAAAIREKLLESFMTHCGATFIDDLTICICKRTVPA